MINSYLVDDLWTVKAPDPPYIDNYHTPGPPIVAAIKGFIEWKSTLVRDISGDVVTSQGSVLINVDTDLSHKDMLRITDSASGDNIDWPIITIKPAKGFFTAGIYVFL